MRITAKKWSLILGSLEQYIVWASVLLSLAVLVWLVRFWQRRKRASRERRFMRESLALALHQKVSFDIKLQTSDAHAGMGAELEAVTSAGLELRSSAAAGEEWNKKPVEAFFHVSQPEGPVFFAFNSRVLKLAGNNLVLAWPQRLRVEKKRHFPRVAPAPGDVLMLAVWPVQPGRRLPRSNSDLGQPALSWKSGQADQPVQLENISGGGVALRLQVASDGSPGFPAEKGRQLICLIVYRSEAGDKVIFWCSGEIMNSRESGSGVALGLEFTNWAVQAQGSTEIHWTHSSPWQGSRPILKWVDQLDKSKAGGSFGSGS